MRVGTRIDGAAPHPHKRMLVCLCLLVAGCSATSSFGSAIRSRTLLDGDTATSLSGPTQRGAVLTYTWDVDSPRDWNDYCERLTQRLQPDFRPGLRDADRFALSKQDGGDVFRLQFERLRTTHGLKVRVTLTATPG